MRRHLHHRERRILAVVLAVLAVVLVAGAALALTSGDDEDEGSLRPSRVRLDDTTVAAGRPLAARVKLRGRAGDRSAPTTVTWHLSFDDEQDGDDIHLVGGGLGDTPAARPAIPRDTPAGAYRVLACAGTECAASSDRVVVTAQAARVAGAETLIAAGDIASCDEEGDEATAELVRGLRGTIAPLGDLAYEEGTAEQFRECYGPTWGTERERTRPVPGNHEYEAAPATAYFSYFGRAAGQAANGWYSYELGDWHVIALNSQCEPAGGCEANSPQGRWLADDLEDNEARCTLAYWHHPRFSSGAQHGDNVDVAPFWEMLHEHGADVVLAGHEHNYERFAPQTPDGKPSRDGIRQFVVGTGGKGFYEFADPRPNSEVRNSDTHGVLELTLRRDGYDWRFLPADGEGFTDSGRGSCR